ncbi:translation elongation factor efp [Rhodospirillum centenum SW]|uniref:Elongation factor G n=2 Tax=Rhodospirillum centenum TaxID=34018 RepID=B6INT5_RHOCS|nr:translation elongation factor efp [Rhodospirillum centenum SW]
MNDGMRSGPRVAALVGPYLSGKTTLLESLLAATGAVARKGSTTEGSSLGDASPEARARHMTIDMNLAAAEFLGERWHFLDCPGSIELAAEAQRALCVADVAVVVCEPDPDKAAALAPLFRFLDDLAIPHMVFINKMDQLAGADLRVRDLMQALQGASQRPLVLRQVPIRDGQEVTGYVDLVSERAYRWRPGQASDLVPLPDTVREREQDARQTMLESLADFDDTLMEQLLEDMAPERGEVYRQLSQDLARDLIVPVFLGCADRDHGVRRLLKALRHETPDSTQSAARLGIPEGQTVVQVFKTFHASHAGKLSIARVWRGTVGDGAVLSGDKASGLFDFVGLAATKRGPAAQGEVVAIGKLEHARSGDVLSDAGPAVRATFWPEPSVPVHAVAIAAEQKTDEVKLTAAIQKLIDEDASLCFQHGGDTGELILSGQGAVHLAIAIDRLRSRYNVAVRSHPPAVPYRETIRKPTEQHARFKRQTGGHGQFADVHVEVRPLARGEGFRFEDRIVGGVIPRTYIPAVEEGAKEALALGPLGFPVVDVAMTLTNGQYHAVDSSEQAFKTAGRMAMQEALPKCEPVLLEPILLVTLSVPSEFTPKVQRMVSQRRGQILGFDARPGWPGWDETKAYIPQADMADLIVEMRSLSQGLGTYTAELAHLAELNGKLADRVIESRAAAIAAQ